MRPLLLAVLAAATSGCGIIYTDVKLPHAYRTAVPAEVKAVPEDPAVSGKSCAYSVLYLVAWGDAGYAAAAKKALQDHPDRVLYDVKSDFQSTSVLVGLYTRNCTVLTAKAAKP